MKIQLKRINDNFHFEARGKSGVPVSIDSNTDEKSSNGASPMELLLMAVGGCNAIDIVSILQKQKQRIDSYEIEVEGNRKEVRQARPFEKIHVTILLEGEIDPQKAKRAAALSFEKYCSVSITMEESVEVSYSIIVNGREVPV